MARCVENFIVLCLVGSPVLSFSEDRDLNFTMASNQEIPESMGSLGDSVTAGAMAAFRRQQAFFPWKVFSVLSKIFSLKILREGLNIVERHDLSWAGAGGLNRDVFSHLKRLRKLKRNHNIRYYNASHSGYESEDVYEKELSELREWSLRHSAQAFPDYVTILAGANDICSDQVGQMKEGAHFFHYMDSIFDELMSTSPHTRVLVSALPNLERLRSVARGAKTLFGSCRRTWKYVGLCHTLTTLENPDERALVAARVQEYNQIMEDLVQEYRVQWGDRIRFAKEVYDIDFNKNDLAVDCFHPNDLGQSKIAEATWKSSWWAGIVH